MSVGEVISILVGLSGLATAFVALRRLKQERLKLAAETKEINARTVSEEVDTMGELRKLLPDMQSDIKRLYTENIALEKINAAKSRNIEVLTARLEARDTQLASCNKQLDLLRNLAMEAPITDALRTQLDNMSGIIAKLQDAQIEATKMVSEKEKIVATLIETNRDLSLKKPPKE
jgi:TolA-binding protein